jgi:hypothetical protein
VRLVQDLRVRYRKQVVLARKKQRRSVRRAKIDEQLQLVRKLRNLGEISLRVAVRDLPPPLAKAKQVGERRHQYRGLTMHRNLHLHHLVVVVALTPPQLVVVPLELAHLQVVQAVALLAAQAVVLRHHLYHPDRLDAVVQVVAQEDIQLIFIQENHLVMIKRLNLIAVFWNSCRWIREAG